MSDPLAEALARKDAAEARRAARRAETPEAALARAKLEADDAEAIAAAEEQHGNLGDGIATVSTPMGVVIVKRPHHVVWKKIENEADSRNKQRQYEAVSSCIRSCLVHPARQQYEAIEEKYPGIRGSLLGLLGKLAAGGEVAASGE